MARLDDGRDLDGLWVLHRPERASPFDPRDAHVASVLARHIGRARRLQLDLDAARIQAKLGQTLLERLPCGLVLLAPDGRVLEANRAAREMASGRDGLALRGVRLACGDAAVDRSLAALVHAAARGLLDGVGGVLAVPRPSGKADYVLSVARCVADLATAIGVKAAVVVTIADPARPVGVEAATLRRLWNLTAAEAQLALALADGATLEEVAARSGISLNTAPSEWDVVKPTFPDGFAPLWKPAGSSSTRQKNLYSIGRETSGQASSIAEGDHTAELMN